MEQDQLTSLCRSIDEYLQREDVRPEDIERRTTLFQPLEQAVAALRETPELPDGPGGKIALSLWCKKHPRQADVEQLMELVKDERAIVRASAVDAVQATLASSHAKWTERQFSSQARQGFQEQREVETSPVIGYQLQQLTDQLGRMRRPARPRRPKVRANPYMAGLPVRDASQFFGREDVLGEIAATLGKKPGVKSIVLYGARRTGKTSVLYRIQDGALAREFIPVYLDMQAFAGTSMSTFLVALLRTTEAAVRERMPSAELEPVTGEDGELQFPALRQFFHHVLARLDGYYLLLLIDEYEVLQGYLSDRNLALQFQHLLESEPGLFAVFAGSRKLETLRASGFEPLLDVSRYLKISFLNREEAMRLIGVSA